METTQYRGYEIDIFEEDQEFFWMMGEDADDRGAGSYDNPGSPRRRGYESSVEALGAAKKFINQMKGRMGEK